jgi:hypothetical protein
MEKCTLNEAISIIEAAGGFVMFSESEEEQSEIITHALKLQDIEDESAKKRFQKEYEERRAQAFEEFDKLLGKPNFSINTVDDICYQNGIDMDDIEDWIFSHY